MKWLQASTCQSTSVNPSVKSAAPLKDVITSTVRLVLLICSSPFPYCGSYSSMFRSLLLLCFALLALSLGEVRAFTSAPSNTPSQTRRVPTVGQPILNIAPTSTALFGKKAARAKGNERKNKTERVKKQKDDVIEVEAVVLESLPNAMFRCAIDDAPETQEPVLATISGRIRKNFVKILVGDKVTIELSPYDLTRGRITFRYR